ncbi:MAG: ATP-binding protein [bacterium]|nr:ATP-binding protein [Eubacterium sp.]MCM1416718.1 ATP-binding protein [bacterium]MCM1424111.1 ATP-binding protein [bacterium]
MELYKRENYLKKIRGFYHSDDLIKVITGVRRCGKSSLMQTISDELALSGVKKENIIYIDLERRGYRNIKSADELDQLIAQYIGIEGMKYLFIDEVQNVKGFEEVVNGFRSEGGWSIFITGSNSYLLSGELVTKLTGRYLEFEMFPLTFEEYLRMKKFYHMNVSNNPAEELNSYITEGGFPRTLFLESEADKRTYVQGVIQEIFQKDIKKRVKIRDTESFEAVQNFIINNFGSTTSINRLCENLRKNGMIITKQTVSKYIKVLADAKILYACNRFDLKSKKSLSGEKKYYLADLSFYFLRNTDNRINYGPTLENMVYIYARAHDYSVSIGKIGKLECDFILRGANSQYSYVQVAYTIALSRDTEDREYQPLEQIHDNYPKYVATTDFLLQQRNGIHHINLIDFMKEGKDF